jgi:hypothetical protein
MFDLTRTRSTGLIAGNTEDGFSVGLERADASVGGQVLSSRLNPGSGILIAVQPANHSAADVADRFQWTWL